MSTIHRGNRPSLLNYAGRNWFALLLVIMQWVVFLEEGSTSSKDMQACKECNPHDTYTHDKRSTRLDDTSVQQYINRWCLWKACTEGVLACSSAVKLWLVCVQPKSGFNSSIGMHNQGLRMTKQCLASEQTDPKKSCMFAMSIHCPPRESDCSRLHSWNWGWSRWH